MRKNDTKKQQNSMTINTRKINFKAYKRQICMYFELKLQSQNEKRQQFYKNDKK